MFVIVLENQSASTTFGPNSPAPYLSKTLRAQGAYVPNYYGVGHESNDNYIAMISGQAPNAQTQADCQIFDELMPGTMGSDGQAQGTGCVYPAGVQTIAGQLTGAGLTWRDYNQSMGADPSREPAECAHPAIGSQDKTQKATATDQYATRHNPFVYFHSIIDDTTLCDTHVVNLDELPQALTTADATPNYVFITPDLCNDGHDAPCADGEPGGLKQADSFLQQWVPQITGSPAFKQDGLLIIAFDEAATSDTSSCCGEIPGPGSPKPGINGPGGGDTGAVLLSPCIAPGTVTQQSYNHYTMLRSVEDIFGVAHLGYAALPGGQSFGSDIFTRACGSVPVARVRAPALASTVSASPRVTVRWSGQAPGGAKIASFTVQVRRLAARPGPWRTLLAKTTKQSLRFRGRAGRSYEFQVQAVDGSGTASNWASATTVMPSGVRVAGGHYHGPWRPHRVRGAWQRHEVTCASARCTFTLSYRGTAVAIIGARGRHSGRMRVALDGKSRTVSLRSRRAQRRAVLYRASSGAGRHRLRVKVLRGAVALEGVGVTP